jgi:hypothetical protein
MLGTLLVIVIVIGVGSRASDAVAVRQQEIILRNLPESEAIAYYEILRKRVRKVAVLRAIALVSLVLLFYAYKHRLAKSGAAAPPPAVTQTR